MTLTIRMEMPEELEQKLRLTSRHLEADVKAAYALELYRQGQITHLELSQLLGLDRIDTSAFLQRHGVYEGSLTMEDLAEQDRTVERVMARLKSQ